MRRLLLLLVAAVMLAAVSESVAPASATTWNDNWSYLHFPTRFDDDGHQAGRTITLNGTYRWRMFVAHVFHQAQPRVRTRIVRLHGRYDWGDVLRPRDGKWTHESKLTNLRTGGEVGMFGQVVLGSFGNGNYHWGSTLDNVRARQ